MATIARTRSSGGSVLLVVVVAFFIVAGATLAPTPQNNHADEKHGADAVLARKWVSEHGRFCHWRCPDGRDRYVCRMNDGKWAIVVLEQTGDEVTAFITTRQSYAVGVTEGCKNDWHLDHP